MEKYKPVSSRTDGFSSNNKSETRIYLSLRLKKSKFNGKIRGM